MKQYNYTSTDVNGYASMYVANEIVFGVSRITKRILGIEFNTFTPESQEYPSSTWYELPEERN